MRRHLSTPRQHGFTLVELTLVIVLLGILSTVGVNMISDSYTTTQIINNGNANTSTARYAMERMSREMRQVAIDGATKEFIITTASSTQMSFTKANFSTQESVTIHSNGSALLLSNSALGVEANLAEHVSLFTLTYFDADMATPPARNGLIRFVEIKLTLSDPGHAEPVALQTLVALRNSGS
jgi:prepilin-type N-terminal cleavage/methylation domain-containing protein